MKTVKSAIHDRIFSVMGVMMRHNYRKMSCSSDCVCMLSCSVAPVLKFQRTSDFKPP